MSETGAELKKALSELEKAHPGDGQILYVNEAGVHEDILDQLRNNNEIASAVESWRNSMREDLKSTVPSLAQFVTGRSTKGVLAHMAQAAWAVESDEILSTTADVTEGLMFQKCRFQLFDKEQEDVWNQWAGEVDMDTFLRKAARELFKVSQVYIGAWWSTSTYTVREDLVETTVERLEDEEERRRAKLEGREPPKKSGPGRGNYQRTKTYLLRVPTALTIFDPTKIVPVGNLMFGSERFAYVASDSEDKEFTKIFDGDAVDAMTLKMIEKKYDPSTSESEEFTELGLDPSRLWLCHREAVFRHCLTKADYERFAPVRMRTIMPILEMKANLRAADRSSLVGTTNAIVVITQGSDKIPAKQQEIDQLQEKVKVIARMPVLVGDHRLEVKIVSPDTTNTLIESRWEVLDSRLIYKALQTFQPTIQGGNTGSQIKEMARIVSQGLESRRHMLVRAIEKSIFRRIMEHNEDLEEFPDLVFTPRRISLDYNAEIIGGILKLRDRGDISRETTLEELDYDQDIEVLRRAREKVTYDPVFQSTTPHSSPTANPYGTNDPQVPGGNVGPNGQPRTEGGRPVGAKDKEPRKAAST